METQLYKAFKKFVYHKKRIINTSRNYNSLKVLISLDKCLRYVDVSREYQTKAMARVIVRLEQDLLNILPHENNRSFSGSMEELCSLLTQSKQIIHDKDHAKIR